MQNLACSQGPKRGAASLLPKRFENLCVTWARLSPGNVQFQPRITLVQQYLPRVCISFRTEI